MPSKIDKRVDTNRPVALLNRLRRVLASGEEKDRRQDKPVRKLLDENPSQFFSQYERLEREFRERREAKQGKVPAAVVQPTTATPGGLDGQSQNVSEIIGRLLERWRSKRNS